MYNYFINFQLLLLGASLPIGARIAALVRLWANPALNAKRRFSLYNRTSLEESLLQSFFV